MADTTTPVVPDEHFQAVWQNRQVKTAVTNFVCAPINGCIPNFSIREKGKAMAKEFLYALINVDWIYVCKLERLKKLEKFTFDDVVVHEEHLLDNEAATELLADHYPDWWQDNVFSELVITTLFVSRVLRLGCNLHYPLANKIPGQNRFDVTIVLPGGQKIIGPMVVIGR